MLRDTRAFSSFSVDDVHKAKHFYAEILGLRLSEIPGVEDGFEMRVPGGNPILVYHKDGHRPAAYTVLNFPVEDVDEAVHRLAGKGVRFERYAWGGIRTDARGIARSEGMAMAWFKDPAGNILSVLNERPAQREEEWATARFEGTEE